MIIVIVMLVDIGFLVVALLLIYAIYRFRKPPVKQEPQAQPVVAEQPPRAGWVRANANDDNGQESDESNEEEDDPRKYEGLTEEEARKKMRKEQKARQRKQRQEQIRQQYKYADEKNQKYREREEQREREEEEKKRKEQEYLEKIAEEDRKRKEEEYKKWKNFFVVESEGKEGKTPQQEEEERRRFNQTFLNYIIDNKICLLEDMSNEFKLSTKDVVDKIKQMETEGKINGVFDERGKYINVTDGEWKAILSYMKAKGRVSKSEMMLECANIIKFHGTKTKDDSLLKLIEQEEQAAPKS